ncbi:hypothetical protein EON64_06950 [archaeon]|nr:MAG: hypothetical protein EON64_06950 [archaeon]
MKKKRLSTKKRLLYYYCYLFIKTLEEQPNNQAARVSQAVCPAGSSFGVGLVAAMARTTG